MSELLDLGLTSCSWFTFYFQEMGGASRVKIADRTNKIKGLKLKFPGSHTPPSLL